MGQVVGEDPLAVLSAEFQREAKRRDIRVMRLDSVVFGEPLPVVSMRDETSLLELTELVESLGVHLMYLSERIVDDIDDEDPDEPTSVDAVDHAGQCEALYVGFPYNGIVHVWERYAPWMDDEFDDDDELDDSGVGARYLSEADSDRLIAYAAEHAALKHLTHMSGEVMRHAVDQHLPDIAREIDIDFDEVVSRHLSWRIHRRVLDNQRNAIDAVDRDLEDWAQRVSQDPDSDRPTAAERDRFCQRLLAENLGFPPSQTLSSQLRKLADSYRKQRSRPDLFAQD